MRETAIERLSEAWMTACDATLVIVQEDRGVYTASLVLSPLMALCVFEEVQCFYLDSGGSSFDGNTREGGQM